MEYKVDTNRDKWFDVRKTTEIFEALKMEAETYCKNSDATGVAYQGFVASEAFMGQAANATKNFVGNGMGKMNSDIKEAVLKCLKNQEDILTGFSEMVDSSPNAYIDYNTLKLIDEDFDGYYTDFKSIAQSVDEIINKLNIEFGKELGEFPKPDKSGVQNAFDDMCGAGSGGGYIKECQNKFISFDSDMYAHVSQNDTKAFANDISSKIAKATGAFNAPQFNTNPNAKALLGLNLGPIDCFIDQCKDFYDDLFTSKGSNNPFDGDGDFGGSAERINSRHSQGLYAEDIAGDYMKVTPTHMAMANTVFYLTKDFSDEYFEEIFGFERSGVAGDLNYYEMAHAIEVDNERFKDAQGRKTSDNILSFLRSHGLDADVEHLNRSDSNALAGSIRDALDNGYAVTTRVVKGTVEHFLKNEEISCEDVSITDISRDGTIYCSYNGNEEVLNNEHGCRAVQYYKYKLKPSRKQINAGIDAYRQLAEKSNELLSKLAPSGKRARQQEIRESVAHLKELRDEYLKEK